MNAISSVKVRNVWNLFKVNDDNDTKTDFTHSSGVSIIDFEQVNAGREIREGTFHILQRNSAKSS